MTDEIKSEISKLIADFKENYKFHKENSEANVETRLVEPLFKALGWDIKDWTKQTRTYRGEKRGRADYIFKIKDRTVFILEVKKVGIPLEKEANKQVISYALSQRIPFAVSTNFECMNIFCVQQIDAINNKFRVFEKPEDYLTLIQDLLYLSKESFEKNIIFDRASSEGRLKKRITIDVPLLEDFMNVRRLISNDIEKTYPNKYEANEKDEIVQRIIDRLIFIRRSEDTGINPDNVTLEEINHLPGNNAYPKLKEIFTKYNSIYNSGLFKPSVDNDCDNIKIDGTIIKELLKHLYKSKDDKYVYDFSWIDADILGQVYEQYLGIILAQTKSGKAKLKDGQAHRKEQGIYYTPIYIVDYIVKNTLGDMLIDKKIKPKNIKILDPACGSGSFLIKAFDYLNKELGNTEDAKQHKLDFQGGYSIKTDMLKNNIYGVDLDIRAVEITKLNLLLKAAEKNRKLPEEVDLHIKNGNSLIDDEKVTGSTAFKWSGDFQKESFDVIIGNPPYVNIEELPKEIKPYILENFSTAKGRFDLYHLFIQKGIELLKNGGKLGFIVPNKFMSSESCCELRQFILKNCLIEKIVNVSNIEVFKDVAVYPHIIIVHKELNEEKKKKHQILISNEIKNEMDMTNITYHKISQDTFNSTNGNSFVLELLGDAKKILDKVKQGVFLDTNMVVQEGIKTGDLKKYFIEKDAVKNIRLENFHKKIVKGADVGRYVINWNGNYLVYDKKNILRPLSEEYFESKKILLQRIAKRPTATIDDAKFYALDTLIILSAKTEELDLAYVLAFLNSDLFYYYYKILHSNLHVSGGYLQYYSSNIKKTPIKILSKNGQQPFIKLVDRMLLLNKNLKSIGEKNTSETSRLKNEIEIIDKDINSLVYKLYGITEAERKIIETSLN